MRDWRQITLAENTWLYPRFSAVNLLNPIRRAKYRPSEGF